ncbi:MULTISPECIES: amino acid ABC transporter ATP-binding protein [Brevibacillus]|jgi:ABC-type polar amino acid transport system ATPase subunit|uniref:amino acid ABC transporter ATP-binding protein n=1 Tax=Brevibacillus TaxID=55080 RepID=UPI00046ADAC1|nr:amino acid ABC transporter ATP-binding protein [Brevibacillus borstelensis]MCC0564920.1 amino acid ABC transporter ATP-binding protein [Brevibacillus borstelensis]MCM3469150.1 amino acid ABC transporter ATP-binding protein [Brevibacillus borstelensis]MCM3560039.1 amino acid ABC transporter ATP-binding protein [Brevibacillus borstelensis]MCM3589670.1 amino acid ABC transporter ATP-binding protein [Brevibacillus borstelensis]MCM3623428.1 amino acid ABC transporter ATP-binding protein [Breviba
MISIRNVSKSYGQVKVLHDIDLEIPQSQVFALIGPSGAGKSTLIRTINALEDIQEGEILIDGVSVHDKKTDINKLRANIGFVFQSFNLYPHLTALENVTIAPVNVKSTNKKEAEEKGKELLASLGLGDKFASYPGQLSGGQQQRVAIARALAMDPKVMLFDEPTSALDPEMVKEVLDAIRKLAATGMTMAVVTHEMGFAKEICNQIVFMAEGKIVEVAEPKEFFSNPKTDRAQDFLAKVLNH